MAISDLEISRLIVERYHRRLADSIDSDVLIAGAGPSGMCAAAVLAERGFKVVVVEKRLSVGGGIWGGGMMMPIVAVQPEAREVLERFDVSFEQDESGLLAVDACELVCALALAALRTGATILTLTAVEDVRVQKDRVTGLVVNRTGVDGSPLPIDPITLGARAVLDATGHDAVVASALQRRDMPLKTAGGRMIGEMPMDAERGERFVVDNAGEVYPGLYVAGMAVCAVFGGPRMGPIFGGMLLSGLKVAEMLSAQLR